LGGSSFRWAMVFLAPVGLHYSPPALAQASTTGQTGMIHMPDARIEPDGVWRFGLSSSDPYFTGWSSISALPRLELSGRFTRIDNVPAFDDGTRYGDYKDKAFDAKWLLLRESQYRPAVGIGVQDFTGTRLFRARYLAVNKQLGEFDVAVGYGEQRIDGWFGGVRYRPAWNEQLSLVLERDANRYPADFGAHLSGAADREGGATYGIEYRLGWLTTQLSSQHGTLSGQLYVSIPLGKREFIPKIDEPPPLQPRVQLPPTEAPRAEPAVDPIVESLRAQGFRDVLLGIEDDTLRLSLTHPRITLMGRAVGRAARTALRYQPESVHTVEITYTHFDVPVLTYRFSDLDLLRSYFLGKASMQELERSIEVRYASADEAQQRRDQAGGLDVTPAAADDDAAVRGRLRGDSLLPGLGIAPFNLRLFFNDPSGVFHYDTFSTIDYERRLAPGLFFDTAARLTLFEDVSDVTQASNSTLAHVRSDIAEYRRDGGRLRLESLLLNRYAQLHERLYGRLSAGYYEEMFGGAGGQLLFLPARGEWAADISLDWLKQRSPSDSVGFRDYTVVTALAAFHYRFPRVGITASARAGRFLAGDEGLRLEVKRRFRSGVEIGAWYTVTNVDDITAPGSPGRPYRDKGIFASIPLRSMLTRDTQARAEFSLVDFTRDVGQMVRSPGDLYRSFERRLMLDSSEYGALSDLAQ